MAGIETNKNLRASILDRLIDNDPSSLDGPDTGAHNRIKDMRLSVRRDLENLLNTRLRVMQPDDGYHELKKSLLNYGLPDLATVNITDLAKRKQFITWLESLIMEFEPRFKSVTVQYRDNNNETDRVLRFRIDAVMYADPSPEVVVFDSVLEPVSRTVNLQEA